MDSVKENTKQEVTPSQPQSEELLEQKARVEAVWQKMNKGVSAKTMQSALRKQSSTSAANKTSQKPSSQNWMSHLGLAPKKTSSTGKGTVEKSGTVTDSCISDDAKKLAAAALLAVKDAAAAASGQGKVEVREVRDFAGEAIEVKKLVDASSKEAIDRGKAAVGSASAVDAILEQIKKKAKLSVLDKTKKDWGEFKDSNEGLEDELETYKKSSNQYLDRVSFLERADMREYERERDVRLSAQAKRKADMREDF